jgi:regulator of chromosome condensation
MPPKKATLAKKAAPVKEAPAKAAKKATTTKKPAKAAAKPAAKPEKPAATGRRSKKMSTEDTVKKEPADKARKTKTTAPTTSASSSASKKRKVDESEEEEKPREQEEKSRPVKKPRVTQARALKAPKAKVVINEAPKSRLHVYVCGEGSSGELGLGAAKNVIDVKRPRLNQLLAADKVGVVQIAVGGMHCVALTHRNEIFTWGVNDQGALGRDTTWDGGYKDIEDNSDSDSDDEDSGLNPVESTPTAIPSGAFPEGTVFVEVAAADSASFALTDDGQVYGWGTFRVG